MKININTALSITFIAVLLTSCSFIPVTPPPSVEVPSRWRDINKSHIASTIPTNWWTIYNDETLNNLIDTANNENLDIRAGIEKINEAKAALEIAGAPLLPNVNFNIDTSRDVANPPNFKTNSTSTLSGGLSVAYELDLFGANNAARSKAYALMKSAQYSQESLRLITQASVTTTYFNLINSLERIKIAEENLDNAKDIQKVVQARFDNGVDSALELAQQKEIVASHEANIATLIQQSKIYQNALALLVGHAPQTFNIDYKNVISKIKVPKITPSQPSVLLERRPDIHAIESKLIAANANIGAARAAFYPSISLGLGTTLTSTAFNKPATTALGLTSSILAPIFSGGELSGNLHAANANQRELVEIYRKTVLTAFTEVEDAIAAVNAASARQKSYLDAVTQSQKAYDISLKRYEVGVIDFQTLLNTQSRLLNAKDTYQQAIAAKLIASSDLVKALGGGWVNGNTNINNNNNNPKEIIKNTNVEINMDALKELHGNSNY